jgi:hypothetical protein
MVSLFGLTLLTLVGAAQMSGSPKAGAYVVTVQASVLDALWGYAHWSLQHPNAMHWYQVQQSENSLKTPDKLGTNAPGADSSSGTTMRLPLPSIDLYAPSGISVYYGTNAAENAQFLHTLPEGIHWAEAHKTLVFRPTLEEAIAMLSQLKPYQSGFLPANGYVIFALSLVGSPSNTPDAHLRSEEEQSRIQDAAMQEFEQRARQAGIRVISVQLELSGGK